jgi:fimbrial isopeptide formation D2 family protein
MIAAEVSTFTLNTFVDPAATAGMALINNVNVVSSTGASNVAGTATVVATPPNVVPSKSVNSGAHFEGSVVTYTIVLTNSGTLAQPDNPGNELTDVLPSSLTLVSASATTGTAAANIGTNTVTWNGTVAGGSSVTITIQATVKSGTLGATISNQASVSYDSDWNGTNESTRQSDDPATGTPSDPTSFVVLANVPALSNLMLILLTAALAAMSLILMRK